MFLIEFISIIVGVISDMHFNSAFVDILSGAYDLTQKTRNFILQFKSNSYMEMWAQSSLDDLSEWILEKLAQRQTQRQGRSGVASAAAQLYSKSGGLHEHLNCMTKCSHLSRRRA